MKQILSEKRQSSKSFQKPSGIIVASPAQSYLAPEFNSPEGGDGWIQGMGTEDLRKKVKYLYNELQQSINQNRLLEAIVSTNKETINTAISMRESSVDRVNPSGSQGNKGFLSGGSKSTKTSMHSANLIIEKLNSENRILL